MRKPKRIALAKETLRNLQEKWLKVAGAATGEANCVGPNIGQHTCAYSNCVSCGHP